METIDVTTLGGSAGTALLLGGIVKQIIAMIKARWDAPHWFPPVAAFLLGPALALLSMAALDQVTGWPAVASGVLTGIAAAVIAGGMAGTQDQERHDPPQPTVNGEPPAVSRVATYTEAARR